MSIHTVHRTIGALALLTMGLAGCGTKAPPAVARPKASEPAKAAPKRPARMAKPKAVRGVYLTAWSAGSSKKMEKVLNMVGRTEVNAVVIDLRDAGHQYVKTDSALAREVGATSRAIRDLPKLIARLVERGVYPIARIACFRDVFVPKKHRIRAVVTSEGALWKDRAGYTWLDPYNRKNWEYIAETVDLALDAGFPEVQLDYVRFPSEGSKDSMRFPARKYYPNPKAKPTEVVRDFAHFVRERVHAQGALLSADIFGIVSSSPSDQGIGQELETIAEPFDVISPMVYPSHFAKGEYGISDPNQAPYGIVLKSLRDYKRRLPNKEIRPWLQDFSLGVTYGAQQVRAQIKACYELGYTSFLLWNPLNRYTEAAVQSTENLVTQKGKAAATGTATLGSQPKTDPAEPPRSAASTSSPARTTRG